MPESTHKQILQAVVERIKSLALAGIGQNVDFVWGAWERDMSLPAVLVTPNGQESAVAATNARDDVSYPVAVLIVDRQAADYLPPIEIVTAARQKIRQALVNQRLTAVPTVHTVELDAAPVVDAKSLEYQLFISPMAFRFTSRETRRA